MPFQRLLFNHIGDGALPRSDPNLSAPEKGGYEASVCGSRGMCNSVFWLHFLQPPLCPCGRQMCRPLMVRTDLVFRG